MPFCSVIVLNFQGEKLIEATLKSLFALDYPKDRYKIIIVDNASKDKSVEIINSLTREFVNPITTLLPLDKNLGFAGGNNEGIKQAKGKYVILLNNDCVVDKSWLTELVKVAEKDEHIFAAGSKVYLRETNKIQNAGIMMFEDGYGRDVGAIVHGKDQDYAEDVGQYDREKETYAACAVAVLYRKSILDNIGYPDDTSFMYYEDVEISERARMHGYKIMYAPHAVVHHHHAASSGEYSPFFIYHSELGRLLHMFFWFPQRIFWREYFKFALKSKLRILYGIKKNILKQQAQYFKVTCKLFFSFPSLYEKRRIKINGINPKLIEKNYQSIRNNVRI